MSLNIYYYNINYVSRESLDELKIAIDKLSDFDVIILTETHVSPEIFYSVVVLEKFNLYCCENVVCCIKKKLKTEEVATTFSSIAFKLILKNHTLNFFCTYVSLFSFKGKELQQRFGLFFDDLQTFHKNNSENFCLIGDLNLIFTYFPDETVNRVGDHPKWPANDINRFTRFLFNNDLKQKNKIPNKLNKHLDVFYTNI